MKCVIFLMASELKDFKAFAKKKGLKILQVKKTKPGQIKIIYWEKQ